MIEQAADWAAQLATREATQHDHDACEDWCRQNPLHRLAMDRMRGLDAQFDSTDEIGRAAVERVLNRRSRNGGPFGGLAGGLLLLIGGGWLAAQSFTARGWFPDYQTARGEQRTIELPDGSSVTIDTDAALDYRSNGGGRTVTLFRGQIFARVAKDDARPFVVETRDGTAAARGTAFIVRRNYNSTIVTVVESRVSACPAKAQHERCADLGAGDRVSMAGGVLEHLEEVDPEIAASWAEGWLAVDDQPAANVLLELNRYRSQPVRFDADELIGVRVSGSFPLDDPDRAIEGIVRSTGLRLSHAPDGALAIARAK